VKYPGCGAQIDNLLKREQSIILIGKDLNVMSNATSQAIKERNPEPIRKCVEGQAVHGRTIWILMLEPRKRTRLKPWNGWFKPEEVI